MSVLTYLKAGQVQQRLGDASTAVSIGSATIAWIPQATELLQFVAAVVAVISGIAAAYYHIKKARQIKSPE